MKKVFNYPLSNSDEIIEVEITTHEKYVECIQDNNFPFKHGKVIIDPNIKIENYKSIIIKCLIPDNQRNKLFNYQAESSMQICYKIIDEFIVEVWKNTKLLEIESLICNHFEMQFKYLILE